MKKKYKKIIIIIVMILSVIGITSTILQAKNHSFNENYPKQEQNMDSETPPDMASDENRNIDEQSAKNDNSQEPRNLNNADFNNLGQNSKLKVTYIVIIGLFAGIFSISLIYLVMSMNNEKFYKNPDKLMIYILTNIILIGSVTIGTTWLTNKVVLKNANSISEENTKKDKVVLDESNVVTEGEIDLTSQETDVTITKKGTYTFSGEFTHSIIIDAQDEEVELILNNVEITNEKTATIIGLSASKIKITLADESKNTLRDGGNSEYDGCIFSNAELVFDGTGTLIVNGNQNEGEGIATEAQNITFNKGEYYITSNDDGINAGGDGATITINDGAFYIDANGDGIDSNKNAVINGGTIFAMGSSTGGDAGIDTDDGFEINGGLVIALGSDMLETPLDTSNQKTIAFVLDKSISKEKMVTLMKEDEVIVSFEANKSFKTILISSNSLKDGDYTLYLGGTNTGTCTNGIYEGGTYTRGEKITVNNLETFTVSTNVNLFGKRK